MDSAWQQRYGASGCGEASGAVEGGGGGGGDRDSSAERGGSMLGWGDARRSSSISSLVSDSAVGGRRSMTIAQNGKRGLDGRRQASACHVVSTSTHWRTVSVFFSLNDHGTRTSLPAWTRARRARRIEAVR